MLTTVESREREKLLRENSELHKEKLMLLMKCRDAMLESMKLTDKTMRLEIEIHRLQIIVDFLVERGARGG
jgi:hypothetical protein